MIDRIRLFHVWPHALFEMHMFACCGAPQSMYAHCQSTKPCVTTFVSHLECPCVYFGRWVQKSVYFFHITVTSWDSHTFQKSTIERAFFCNQFYPQRPNAVAYHCTFPAAFISRLSIGSISWRNLLTMFFTKAAKIFLGEIQMGAQKCSIKHFLQPIFWW